MDSFYVRLKTSFEIECFGANIALKFSQSFMDWCDVVQKILPFTKAFLAKIAFMFFDIFMNSLKMCLKADLISKCFFTDTAFEIFYA